VYLAGGEDRFWHITISGNGSTALTTGSGGDGSGDSRPQGAGYELGADELGGLPGLGLNKPAGDSLLSAGETVVYTIVVTSTGAVAATNTHLTDTLPLAFLIQVFFGGSLDREEILAQLRRQLALHQERLAEYQETVREAMRHNVESTGLEREGFFWGLTLEAGIRYEEGWIEWCQEAIERVAAMDDGL